MTDEEYIFHSETREKKRIARGVHNKRTHNGKSGCKTPSDYMTRKEREAMNGEIVSWKEKPFYTREEFRTLPDDVKLKWVNSAKNIYGCGLGGISEVCFGEKAWLKNEMIARGLFEYINKSQNGAAAQKGKAKLREAFDNYTPEETQSEETSQGETTAEESTLIVTSGRLVMQGTVEEIADGLKRLFSGRMRCTFEWEAI
jgi:hypothetical protein